VPITLAAMLAVRRVLPFVMLIAQINAGVMIRTETENLKSFDQAGVLMMAVTRGSKIKPKMLRINVPLVIAAKMVSGRLVCLNEAMNWSGEMAWV
jgi:hypothetical protein